MTATLTARVLALAGVVLFVGCGQEPTTPPAPVARIEITPATGGILIGATLQLTATVYDASGNVLGDRPVTWTSSAPAQATVTSTGLVSGIAMSESVFISAASEGTADTATIAVVMDLAGEWNFSESIEVWWFISGNPIQGVATIGASCSDTGSFQLTQSGTIVSGTIARIGDCLGHPSLLVPLGSWDNTAPGFPIANGHVSGSHLSIGIGGSGCAYNGDLTGAPAPKAVGTYECPFSGRIWIKGTWEATRGGAPVSTVNVRWDTKTVSGGAVQLIAVPRDASGHVLNRPVTWASDNPSVATVSTNGLVTTSSASSAHITATSGTIIGSAAVTAELLRFRSVSAGYHGCGATVGGAAYCWGWGGNGELGTGFRSFGGAVHEPILSLATPRAVALGHSFAALSAGILHSCGVTPTHDTYCWGDNTQGQLGDGSTTSSLVPVLVTGGHQFANVTVGFFHSCGLTTASEVYCWGNNEAGQLGRAGASSNVPMLVGGDSLRFQTLRSGLYHNCAITPAQDAYCWGYNGFGQVGSGTSAEVVTSPSIVHGGHPFVAIGAGYAHSCGITSDGAAFCWGSGSLIGDGSFDGDSLVPSAVTGGPFAAVDTALAVGQENTCALTVAGAAYCWGHNSVGQLGDGSTTDRATPVPVLGGLTFASLSVGIFVTCGVSAAGVAYCWGDNIDGRAGVNATESCDIGGTAYACATRPVPIIGQAGQVGIGTAWVPRIEVPTRHVARQVARSDRLVTSRFAPATPRVPALAP